CARRGYGSSLDFW
nr:immunoglobulin heavy chain junction region [Mus musculus]